MAIGTKYVKNQNALNRLMSGWQHRGVKVDIMHEEILKTGKKQFLVKTKYKGNTGIMAINMDEVGRY